MMTHAETAAIRAAVEQAGREATAELVAAVETELKSWWTRLDWLTPVELRTAAWIALAEVERLAVNEAAARAGIGGAA
jgi:hypothetical protein